MAVTRITIDQNIRVRGNQTFSSLEDADGPLALGQRVLAVEPEDGIVADAIVTDIDAGQRLVYLTVDWRSLRDDPEATEDPACE